MNVLGYKRENGTVGFRNYVLILPSVSCANKVAEEIADGIEGVVAIPHQCGCGQLGEDREQTTRVLVNIAANPNVAAVVVVGLGCEGIPADLLGDKISSFKKPVEIVVIQKEGGSLRAIEKGRRLALKMVENSSKIKREPVSISEITLGLKCGGSDSFSGISANPVLGFAVDSLIAQGGRAVLTEISEIIGAEHILAKRAANEIVKKRILEVVTRFEKKAISYGVDIRGTQPSPGNIRGGLTTIEEKSIGSIIKSGTTPIREVVEYGEIPREKGVVLMNGPAYEPHSLAGLLATGVQIIAFTTGRGNPCGTAIAPVIKISSNTRLYERMNDNIDFNAGVVVSGEETFQQAGQRLLNLILNVASGEMTRAEILKDNAFDIWRLGTSI